jgi:hypothetical protein
MSDDTDFEYAPELAQEVEVETPNPARAQQRKMEKELRESKAELKAAQDAKSEGELAKKELNFIKAGIDTSTPQGKLLLKAYDGENSLDAIKAAGEEYGLIATSQTTAVANELSAIEQVSRASNGASASLPTSVFDEMKSATSEAEVLALYAKHGIPLDDQTPGAIYRLV